MTANATLIALASRPHERCVIPGQSVVSLIDSTYTEGRIRCVEIGAKAGVHRHAQPLRDRAIVYTLLSNGLRREELVDLDLTSSQSVAAA